MSSFDISSEVDEQEMRNAVDQASRELATRFDFKDTNSSIELSGNEITLRSVSQDRLNAVRQVLEEKLVKRQISMKALDYGKVEDAAGGTVRQVASLVAGINSERAKDLNKFIKALGLKGIQSQTQGEQIRVIGKKRDDLQAVIQACKEHDFGIPLQFGNFRD
ncbi:MAG TPA: YajQ family cyclic di-GMP-binding protein [Microthrixaceae bacterium]|nr:YajQ family cyclic di-GMP-binding protein [Microthrixaceae bacterium]HNI35095.1 YajQ family cyclic di-GMP-binding protein [Microthrixaceae bacterium]